MADWVADSTGAETGKGALARLLGRCATFISTFACLVMFQIPVAGAAERTVVAIELLLALDASASVERQEFQLQLQGLALAFRDPEVIAAVENLKPLGVAIGLSQWGGRGQVRMTIPFTHIASANDAKAFGFLVGRSFRFIGATGTSIVTGIEHGLAELESNAFDGYRRVIDVSGDGEDNSGLSLEDARENARAQGVIINGLAIEADEPRLMQYYLDNVRTGAGAFVERANDFEDFARAIKQKLLRELRPFPS
jgi:Protein of unknown function (DUF1194)